VDGDEIWSVCAAPKLKDAGGTVDGRNPAPLEINKTL